LLTRIAALAAQYPGLSVEASKGVFRIVIPDALRTSHEAHFGEVTRAFFEQIRHPASRPGWENANLLSKYFTTTAGTKLSETQAVGKPIARKTR